MQRVAKTLAASLPSATKCEGYVFTGMCLSTGGGAASVHVGIPHPGPGIPRTRRTPQEQVALRNRPSQTRHPPQQTATAADDMHSTGMHSCLLYYYCNIFLTGGINYLFDTYLVLILLVDGDRHGGGYVSLLSMQKRS